jgi:hypothetical protein
MNAAQFKKKLAKDPSFVSTSSDTATFWFECDGATVTPLASSVPPFARTGVVVVLS